jgi:hypothetical protein
MSSLGTAWQRLLSFHVQWLPSLMAGVYLTSDCHTQARVRSQVASDGGCSSSSRFTSSQAGDHLTPTSYSDPLQTALTARSVNPLNCCSPTPAQSFLASGLVATFDEDYFFSPRHVHVWEMGPPFWGEGSVSQWRCCICCTVLSAWV